MELIVAVYDDWGIGCCGTQPIALAADRKFFRQETKGSMVIVGRKTIDDFPGKQPLPGRINVAISRNVPEIPGFIVVKSVEEAAEYAAQSGQRAMVIGGGSIYKQMMPIATRPSSPRCTPPLPVIPISPTWTKILSGS